MPIYEFYCKNCNTIFNFFSKKVNTKKHPSCPRCKGELKRQVSLFSTIERSGKEASTGDIPIDERKLEKAMSSLAAEAENMSGEDPRQAADFMRKFSDMTGVKLGDGMQEALKRMEAGEDPEKIEAEMGDLLESEEPFLTSGTKAKTRGKIPIRDETLYEL